MYTRNDDDLLYSDGIKSSQWPDHNLEGEFLRYDKGCYVNELYDKEIIKFDLRGHKNC